RLAKQRPAPRSRPAAPLAPREPEIHVLEPDLGRAEQAHRQSARAVEKAGLEDVHAKEAQRRTQRGIERPRAASGATSLLRSRRGVTEELVAAIGPALVTPVLDRARQIPDRAANRHALVHRG